jgi:hypothetical protein
MMFSACCVLHDVVCMLLCCMMLPACCLLHDVLCMLCAAWPDRNGVRLVACRQPAVAVEENREQQQQHDHQRRPPATV